MNNNGYHNFKPGDLFEWKSSAASRWLQFCLTSETHKRTTILMLGGGNVMIKSILPLWRSEVWMKHE